MTDERQRERMRDELDRRREEQQERAEEAAATAHQEQLLENPNPDDAHSARAKSWGHGKKTADKWNQ